MDALLGRILRSSALGRMIRKLIERHAPAQEAPEPGRLRRALLTLAARDGFVDAFPLFPAAADAEVCLRNNDGWIFVGLVKDAARASPLEAACATHVRERFLQFQGAIRGSGKRGVFAVMTNAREAAEGWARLLTIRCGLSRLRFGDGSDGFKVRRLDAVTWVVA